MLSVSCRRWWQSSLKQTLHRVFNQLCLHRVFNQFLINCADVEFLNNCVTYRLQPKFLRFKLYKKEKYKSKKVISLKENFLFTEIRQHRKEQKKLKTPRASFKFGKFGAAG